MIMIMMMKTKTKTKKKTKKKIFSSAATVRGKGVGKDAKALDIIRIRKKYNKDSWLVSGLEDSAHWLNPAPLPPPAPPAPPAHHKIRLLT